MPLTAEDLAVLNTLRDLIAKNATDKGFRAKMREDMTEEQWEGSSRGSCPCCCLHRKSARGDLGVLGSLPSRDLEQAVERRP